MKIKRYKHARRILNFYKRNFELREPYQIIGEPSLNSKGYFEVNMIKSLELVVQCEVDIYRSKGFSILIV